VTTIVRVRRICLALPGAEESVLQDRPMFHVRRRRFALVNLAASPARARWDGCGESLHFLADADELPALLADDRFTPSPHHGDRGWLMVRLDGNVDIDWSELAELLRSAHARAGGRQG
jgi:predicted DNA-binding protein (MmcQ/YjbR family)